jgi:hypothetical protein
MSYSFFNNCVNWNPQDVYNDGGLSDLIEHSISITRSTFLKHVNAKELQEIAENLGYSRHPSQGLTMAGDWHISYHRSKHHGERAYYFAWSGIEYVFKLSH